MEKYKDLFGMFVACGEGQHEAYMMLKADLEAKLNDALKQVKKYGHEGFDVGFVTFNSDQAVLSCCLDEQSLWIGLYRRNDRSIQRYVIFDDIKSLRTTDIQRFANVIENIARNSEKWINTSSLVEAWKAEFERISQLDRVPEKPSLTSALSNYVEQANATATNKESNHNLEEERR